MLLPSVQPIYPSMLPVYKKDVIWPIPGDVPCIRNPVLICYAADVTGATCLAWCHSVTRLLNCYSPLILPTSTCAMQCFASTYHIVSAFSCTT